eukprot:348933-Amphidinium_carterae.2
MLFAPPEQTSVSNTKHYLQIATERAQELPSLFNLQFLGHATGQTRDTSSIPHAKPLKGSSLWPSHVILLCGCPCYKSTQAAGERDCRRCGDAAPTIAIVSDVGNFILG